MSWCDLCSFVVLQHLPIELGGTQNTDIETWIMIQQHVDNFTHRYWKKSL
jgi:hypothetical protein